jgi:hypothetical protein
LEFPDLKLGTARRIIDEIRKFISLSTPSENAQTTDLIGLLKDCSAAEYSKSNADKEFRNLLKWARLPADTRIESIALNTIVFYIDRDSALWRTKTRRLMNLDPGQLLTESNEEFRKLSKYLHSRS